nr:RNA-dependent RNA polymerase [Flumine noda-like virus 27]
MCDIKRQIVKFHVCVRMNSNVTPTMKLLEKVRSFSLSDNETPIIGDLCQTVQRIHGKEIKDDDRTAPMRSWLSRYSMENQYINKRADWMIEHTSLVLPEFEYKRFISWTKRCKTLDDVMKSPMYMEPIPAKSEVPVVVDDDVLPYGCEIKMVESESKYLQPIQLPIGLTLSAGVQDLKYPDEAEVKLPKASSTPPPATTTKKEKKINVDQPLKTMATEVLDNKKPVTVKQPKETFEELKARKIKAGTWVERPVLEDKYEDHKHSKADKKGAVTVNSNVKTTPKESYEAMKKRKIADGTWKDFGSSGKKPAEGSKVSQPPGKKKGGIKESWRKG